ncbi:MAG: class I SAM-dependent methyltransferase [Candidatus Lindowbacteria bacterium]|nr:class I SAM-dependent methyltransferase [Candidatus Lindowbacteria bacterium]
MEQGDFSALAENYRKYRSGYSPVAVDALKKHVGADKEGFKVADVGAGTGIWTGIMLASGLDVTAVEPNDAMREQGIAHTKGFGNVWKKGSGSETSLEDSSVDWVIMASSFHWVGTKEGLPEFSRILKPGGYFTALWNPRNIKGNEFHESVEAMIKDVVPELTRVSSGSSGFAAELDKTMYDGDLFKDVTYIEEEHDEVMSKERYIGVWRSVNDIQAQAGLERFEKIISNIEKMIENMENVVTPYKTRAWTAQKV